MDHELSVDLVLQSLPQSFLQFITNYHVNKLDSTLLNMLRFVEEAFKKKVMFS
jgi:hypothetical protein